MICSSHVFANFGAIENLKYCKMGKEYRSNGFAKTKLQLVQSLSNYYGFVYYEKGISRVLFKDKLSSNIHELMLEDRVTDLKEYQGSFYAVVKNRVFKISSQDFSIEDSFKTLPKNYRVQKYSEAITVNFYKDLMIISHGELGISFINLYSKKVEHLFKPEVPQPLSNHSSMVTDILILGDKLVVSFDDVTLARDSKAFEGIVTIDLNTLETLEITAVNQKMEAYYMPRLYKLNEKQIAINNLHLNFVHDVNRLHRSRYMKPQRRIWKYTDGKLIGRGFIENNKLYGCFETPNLKMKNGVFSF